MGKHVGPSLLLHSYSYVLSKEAT